MRRVISGSCIAAMLTIGAAAFAQTTGQNPTGTAGQAGAPTASGRQVGDVAHTKKQVTMVGCIQGETEYRESTAGGRGGALGTGVGVGNEYVLINAKPGSTSTASSIGSPASSTPTEPTATTSTSATSSTATSTAATSTATTPETTGTSGSTVADKPMTSGGSAYSLTGDREKDLKQHVGQKVEITGTLEGDHEATAGATTGTAGTTSAQKAGDLPRINIASFRAMGPCNQ